MSDITIMLKRDETEADGMARATVDPATRAGVTARRFSGIPAVDHAPLVDAIRGRVDAVKAGDMSEVEAMLVSQAISLDGMFNELARRAALNMGESLKATETYLRLAFKAQGQCRATLEALADLKNPRPVTITQQANIAGQQVVNNNFHPNELIGGVQHGSVDTGTAAAASGTYPQLAAVAKIDRGNNPIGESEIVTKRGQARAIHG